MASAMDSGVDTGNDSNDSSVQEKLNQLPKMDQENSPMSKSSDSGKETTSEEEQDDRNLPSSSENKMEEGASSMSLTHLQPASLMHGYEYQPLSPSHSHGRNINCVNVSIEVDVMNAERVGGVFVSGGPFGTEYKGNQLVTKMRPMRNPSINVRCYRNVCYHKHKFRGSVNITCSGKPWVCLDTIRMCRAASHNNTSAMREMLISGMSPNVHDHYKRTPLHLAACMGYADMVKLLLEHGANPNAKDSIGNTPLHLAACTNHVNVITLLLKAGTRVCERDLAGHSPLQLAITKFNIMKRSIMPHPVLKEQVCQVITMLTEYMRRKEGATIDPDLLNKFESLVRVSDSSEEVETNIRDLLSNLSSLSLSNTS